MSASPVTVRRSGLLDSGEGILRGSLQQNSKVALTVQTPSAMRNLSLLLPGLRRVEGGGGARGTHVRLRSAATFPNFETNWPRNIAHFATILVLFAHFRISGNWLSPYTPCHRNTCSSVKSMEDKFCCGCEKN